jgi:hypothetical protein
VTRVVDNVLSEGQPRRTPADPPGYSPIRWMWDFTVDSSYVQGRLDAVSKLDQSNSMGTSGVRNMPLRGIRTRCSYPMQLSKPRTDGSGSQCGKLIPDPMDPTNENKSTLEPKGDPACTSQGLECNPETCFCDAPFVGYGQKCGPGIAQCNKAKDDFSDHGYTCLFPFGGYCYIQCATGDLNTHLAENAGKKQTEILDSRCKSIPGYQCLGAGFLGRGNGICLKFCDSNVTTGNQCEAKATMDMMEKDIDEGQVCQDFGIEVCSWPDGFEPAQ